MAVKKRKKQAAKSERAAIHLAVIESMSWLPEAIDDAARKAGTDKADFMRRSMAEVSAAYSENAKDLYESWLKIHPGAKPLLK